MSNITVEQIELSKEEAQKTVKMGQCMERLITNPDFDELIHEHYFKNEASRLVLLKAHPNLQDEKSQRDIDLSINAIGHFRQFMMGVRFNARQAVAAIEAADDELERMRQEDLDK